MPNNTNTSYVETAMKTARTQIFMVVPIFFIGPAMDLLKGYKLNGKSIATKSLRLLKPLNETELKELETNYRKTSKILNVISRGALVIQMANGALYSLRAANLQSNLGNEKVAEQDIVYSWVTSAIGMIPPVASVLSNVTQRLLLSCVPNNNPNDRSPNAGSNMSINVINGTDPAAVTTEETAEGLFNGREVEVTHL